jgi:hypothetical protein
MKKFQTEIGNWYKKYQFQIHLILGLRILYSLWLAIVWFLIDKYIPISEGVLWETYYNLSRSPTLLGRALIDVWLRWDAVHYMNIAAFGYEGVGVGDTVFFPLYPYLVGLISRLTSINVTLVGIVISSIATLFALIFLYDLVIELFQDKRLAKWSTVCLAIYPTAFFLHAPYTDALFLSLSIGSILMMVRKKSVIAGFFVCLAGLTRAQGILLLIPMIIFYIQNNFPGKKFLNWRDLQGFLIAPLGFLGYSYWRMQLGAGSILQTYQAHSNAGFRIPTTNIILSIENLINKPSLLVISELFSVLFFLAILVWMSTQDRFQKHIAIFVYSFSTWVLITSKTTYWASPLQSANRYVLHIFFVFVGLASIFLSSSKKKQNLLLLFFISNLFLLLLYSIWIFIG